MPAHGAPALAQPWHPLTSFSSASISAAARASAYSCSSISSIRSSSISSSSCSGRSRKSSGAKEGRSHKSGCRLRARLPEPGAWRVKPQRSPRRRRSAARCGRRRSSSSGTSCPAWSGRLPPRACPRAVRPGRVTPPRKHARAHGRTGARAGLSPRTCAVPDEEHSDAFVGHVPPGPRLAVCGTAARRVGGRPAAVQPGGQVPRDKGRDRTGAAGPQLRGPQRQQRKERRPRHWL